MDSARRILASGSIEKKSNKHAVMAIGYKSAGVFANPSLKVFNEYNPGNDKQFGMNFGDFRDNVWSADACKRINCR